MPFECTPEISGHGKAQQVIPVDTDQISPRPQLIEKRNPHTELEPSSSFPVSRNLKAKDIVEAWDRVGTISSEIVASVINQEATTVAESFKRANSNAGPPKKRQKKRASQWTDLPSQENWSQALSRRMDRMSRMSMLLMQVEYYHRLLRSEIAEVKRDLNI
jgi:hypothetical protein